MLLRMLYIALCASTLTAVTGCSSIYSELGRDPRDARWDPKPGHQLFEQIPNEDGGALRRCGGHMNPEQARREGRSMRC
jgi:hypothetical protein